VLQARDEILTPVYNLVEGLARTGSARTSCTYAVY